MNVSSIVKTAKSVITANSPVLLVGTAIAGVVSTGFLAAKGGYKARGLVDAAENEAGRPLTMPEKVQLTWLCYAVPGVTGASSIAAIIGAHTIHTKRANAMAVLYAATTNKLDDLTESAEALLGPKKNQQLTEDLAQKELDRNPIGNHEVIMTGHGSELCYDSWSGRYFSSSMAKMENAINEINRQLVDDGDASLNDFYDHLGLPTIPMGDNFGWSGIKIGAKFGGAVTPDDRSAITISFRETPKAMGACP